MKIEEYIEKYPNDSELMMGLIAFALVDNWNRKYDPEHVDKLNRILECYLSARDAQIELAELLCTSKDGDKCKANYGAPCVHQCIYKQPEPMLMCSWSCDREIIS